MATERWVANASPLILLGNTDNLDLLAALAEAVVVPRSVADEVGAKPDGTCLLAILARHPRYVVFPDEAVPPELLAWDLGAGESQVITHARRHGADRVVLDDREARRCARVMELKMIGTLGVVARAKRLGHLAAAAPVIEHLRRTGFYVTEARVQQILREVGE